MHKRFNKTERNYIIIGLCMILVIMGVGYAAFQSQLKISGTSNITSNWSVKITNIQSKVVSGAPTNISEPTHTDTTATFRTRLTSPGDTMQYDVTVSNEGDIDAKLDKITVPENTNPAIGFEVSGIEEGSLLEAKQTAILTVTVKYNNVTEQPEDLTADLKVTLDYSQAPDGYVPPAPSITSEDLKALAVTEGEGLYKDEYEEGRFIYKGTNPNNYITFNNETWRIISIEADGRIKIMGNYNIGYMEWDTNVINIWDNPSEIKIELNDKYLNTITVNKDKIVPSTWSIGAVTWDNNDLADQIADENGTQSQLASVGLITVSEYLRANTNKEQCESFNLNNDNYNTCKTTNWLIRDIAYWTISAYAGSIDKAFGIASFGGAISEFDVYISYAVFPAMYLINDINLSGSGTESDPFQIVQ